MKQVVLNKGKEQKYLNSYPLIEEEDIYDLKHVEEGEIVALVDYKKDYIATAFYGEQNKGIGWVLTYDSSAEIDHQFFVERFQKALDEREYYYNVDGTNAFRLFNAEGDGIGGLTIDNYNGNLLIQWYSVGIHRLKDRILPAIQEVFDYESIFEKRRFKGQETVTEHLAGKRPEFPIVIEENHLFYNVHLDDGPMTGIFLDQKEVRKKLKDQYSYNKDVLNLFSYTGAFSVAAGENANRTTSVDLANRSRSMTEDNFGLNVMDLDKNDIYVMEVFDYYKYAKRHALNYDVIVIDPPSFVRNKKKTFTVQNDYPDLIEGAVDILNSEGILVLSTNSSAYPQKSFKNMIKKTLSSLDINFTLKDVMGLPKDFKTHEHYKPSKYLKVVFVQVHD